MEPVARQGYAQHDPERGIPDDVRRKVVKLALEETELSPRELAMTFTHRESYPRPLSLGPMAFQWLDIRGINISDPEGT